MSTLVVRVINNTGSDVGEALNNKITYWGLDHSAHFHTDLNGNIEEIHIHKSNGSIQEYVAASNLICEVGYVGRDAVFDSLLSSKRTLS